MHIATGVRVAMKRSSTRISWKPVAGTSTQCCSCTGGTASETVQKSRVCSIYMDRDASPSSSLIVPPPPLFPFVLIIISPLR